MGESAKDQVAAILAETRRRKEIWALMQKAAHEALRAVTVEARRRGVQGQKWLGGNYASDNIFITFPSLAYRHARLDGPGAIAKLAHNDCNHSFELHGSGSLERPSKTTAYEGYPKLYLDDVSIFKQAAVEQLMQALNEHLVEKRRQQKRR